MGRKHKLDKFYTKTNIAKKLVSLIDIKKYGSIIEPSAGNGSFSKLLHGCIAYDIKPENNNIIKADFLSIDINIKKRPVLVIGNPPFGRQNNLAIQFIKKSSLFADTIAFILPKSFKKQSLQNKISLSFHLDKEIDLPYNSFYMNGQELDIPCVFQIWNKKSFDRKLFKKVFPKGFAFVKKNENPDIAIRRVGVYAGMAYLDINKSGQSHYFLKTNLNINNINKIEWEHNNTVGPRSISKQELIRKLNLL